MRTVIKKLSSVTKEERLQLHNLTLKCRIGENRVSLMRVDVLQRTKDLDKVIVFLLKEGQKIIGWSSLLLPVRKSGKRAGLYTYIMRKHRRYGYGSKLIKLASDWAKRNKLEAIVWGWNKSSNNFFKKCKDHSKITIFNIESQNLSLAV